MKAFPSEVNSGFWPEGHVQGIAVDEERGYVYYSFTTILLKTDFEGNPVGSVENIAGHLGCITFDAIYYIKRDFLSWMQCFKTV